MLDPRGVDPQGDDAHRLAEVHPVDHQRGPVRAGQVRGELLRERGSGHRHELPRDRRLARRRRRRADLVADRLQADRLQADRVAASGQAGHRHRHHAQNTGAAAGEPAGA